MGGKRERNCRNAELARSDWMNVCRGSWLAKRVRSRRDKDLLMELTGQMLVGGGREIAAFKTG